MGCCLRRTRHRPDYVHLQTEALTDGNKFIGPPEWEGNTNMTADQLIRKRTEFWETAPAFGGHLEIWEALKSACEFSLSGDFQMVQAIIDGAGLILTTGYLTEVYDQLGHKYTIPYYCTTQLAVNSSSTNNKVRSKKHIDEDSITTSPLLRNVDREMDSVNLKLRIPSGKDIKIEMMCNATVLEAKTKLSEEAGIPVELQKWCLGGKLLNNKTKIDKLKIPRGFVVQVCVCTVNNN